MAMTTENATETVLSGDDIFNALPPIFRACVDAGDMRHRLGFPWHRNGYAFSTDGTIAVRMRIPDHIARAMDAGRGAVMHPPNIEVCFKGEFQAEGIAPPRGPRGFAVCDVCGGFGVALSRDKRESETCEECLGRGCVRRANPVEVAPGVHITAHCAAIFRRFAAEIHLPVEPNAIPGPLPLRFVMLSLHEGETVDGVVMRCDSPREVSP